MSSWSSVIVRIARRGSGSASASSIRSARRSGLTASSSDARGEPLRGRLVRAVDREHDLEDALRRLDEPLHPRERGVVARDREDAARCPASPALGRGLAPLGDELVGIVRQPLLRAREPRAAAQRDAVRDRLRRGARREPLLGERGEPPDRLDRLPVEVAVHAPGRGRRVAPRLGLDEPRGLAQARTLPRARPAPP